MTRNFLAPRTLRSCNISLNAVKQGEQVTNSQLSSKSEQFDGKMH